MPPPWYSKGRPLILGYLLDVPAMGGDHRLEVSQITFRVNDSLTCHRVGYLGELDVHQSVSGLQDSDIADIRNGWLVNGA